MLGAGLKGGMSLMALWRGPHWMISDAEALIWSTDLNDMLYEVLPKEYLEAWNAAAQKYGPVVGASLTTAAIVGKRLRIDAELRAAEARSYQSHSGSGTRATTDGAAGFDVTGSAGAGVDNGRGNPVDAGGYAW